MGPYVRRLTLLPRTPGHSVMSVLGVVPNNSTYINLQTTVLPSYWSSFHNKC
jgi:hypothetical protein